MLDSGGNPSLGVGRRGRSEFGPFHVSGRQKDLLHRFRNIYPTLASSEKARYLIIAVCAVHVGMALAMKVLFFS
jgi:hypothetical protein